MNLLHSFITGEARVIHQTLFLSHLRIENWFTPKDFLDQIKNKSYYIDGKVRSLNNRGEKERRGGEKRRRGGEKRRRGGEEEERRRIGGEEEGRRRGGEERRKKGGEE